MQHAAVFCNVRFLSGSNKKETRSLEICLSAHKGKARKEGHPVGCIVPSRPTGQGFCFGLGTPGPRVDRAVMDLPLDPALEDLLNTPLDLDSLGHSGLQADLPVDYSSALPALILAPPAGLFDVLDVDPFADTPVSARRQLHRNAYSANDLASLARDPEPEPGLDLQFLGTLPRIPEASGSHLWPLLAQSMLPNC